MANTSNGSVSTPTSPTHANSASALADKPRLTEQEKKNNHIASEQKRRQAIREGFDEIAAIVPGLEGQGRSEAIVLDGATKFIKRLLADLHNLIQEAKSNGMDTKQWELDWQTMEIAAMEAAAEQQRT